MRRAFLIFISALFGFFSVSSVYAENTTFDASRSTPSFATTRKLTCNSYNIIQNMFTDVCWSAMFPIRIMGIKFFGGGYYPENAYKKVLCKCGGDLKQGELPKLGFAVGMWMPSRLVDVTRKPLCFSSLGGIEMNFGQSISLLNTGANRGRGQDSGAFYNWVMYSAPFIYMLRLLDDGACAPEGFFDFDVLYFSTIFPNWNDTFGRYTMFLNPEAVFLANIFSYFAMPLDVMSIMKNGKPDNRLFWVAGNWGKMYPLYGWQQEPSSIVAFSSLIATRALFLMHRLGLVKDTVGEENICKRKVRYMMRKDAFRWQMVSPSPETADDTPQSSEIAGTVQLSNFSSKMNSCAHPTGTPTAAWGMWRDVPGTGEDHSYMIFRWVDCCFGFTPGL